MATSTFPGRSDYQIDYTVSTVKQEIANNRSLVRRRLLMKNIGSGSGAWNHQTNNSWSVSGPNNQSGSFSFDFRNYSTLTLLDRQDWVTHNSDGTKSFSSSASVSADLPNGMSTANVSMSVTLKTIPRATTPSIASKVTTGTSVTISLPRASSSFTHDVILRIGLTQETLATGAGTSLVWTPPHSLASKFTSSPTTTATLIVKTKNGSTVIGEKSVKFTLEASPSLVPTIDEITWVDNNPKTAEIAEQFIQNLSLLTPSFTASGVQGSRVLDADKRIEMEGLLYTVDPTIRIRPKGSGTIATEARITDSRGRIAERTQNISVLPYTGPQIGSGGWSIYRADPGSYLPNPEGIGESIVCQIHTVTTQILKAENPVNFVKMLFRYKTFDTPWSGWSWYTSSSHEYNGRLRILAPTGGFLNTKSYEIEIVVEDTVGGPPIRFITTVPTTSVAMDLHGESVGIGKIWERGSLDVAGDIYSRGVNILDLMPIGSIQCFAGPDNKIPAGWHKCDGTWLERSAYPELYEIIGDSYTYTTNSTSFQVPDLRGRVPVGYNTSVEVFNTIGKKTGTRTHTLTTDQIPSHRHSQVVTHTGSTTGATRRDWSSDGAIGTYAQGASTNTTGGGSPHSIVQPSLVVNWIIRVNRQV